MELPRKYTRLLPSKKTIGIIIILLGLLVSGGYIASRLYLTPSLSEQAGKTISQQLITALTENNISKATKFDTQGSSNAQYYALIAQQMGGDYKLTKTDTRSGKEASEHSYIFKSDKPKRPNATYLRVITTTKDNTSAVKSVFASIGEPSAWPADKKE